MTNILASNTDPRQNPIWGDFAIQAADGSRRPATIKTGTSQDANDLVAFGYLAPPDEAGRAAGEYALVVGAWNGNSDGSPVLTPENPVLSTDAAAPMWHGFLQEVDRRAGRCATSRGRRASSTPRSTRGAAARRPSSPPNA